ncbi:protein O-mannosyl-transferase family [Robiginitalea sp. IMCC43444]|uniref:protein O-mannosyl-transferase family n=1 Tax=Robiginitalea sp. IMCC43444 TaxID=3459121 RepID=UPI004043716A
MLVKNFEKINTLMGWFVFFIALITYGITVEPTGSFWDAGEYIATSAKLQVAHPPGAPLLQMIGAFFSLFALEADQVAKMVNYVSGVSAALTILFMFWTITNLSGKLLGAGEKMSSGKAMAMLGAGLVGCLTLTYSDSFWFNAVETEVYAMASFIMSVLLWMGLKWTDNLDSPRGNRWLVLICFVVGLTFGIQFMGFLAIPSIGLLYYFKRYKTTTVKNFLLANVAVVAVLILVYKFSLTYVLKLFGWGEVFFINEVGLPFNSGTIIIGILFASAFYFGLNYTRRNNYRKANTLVLCGMFLFLGFSSWLMLPIRANANVIINENNPADARALLAYYNREQYPGTDSPVYGAYYSDLFAPAGPNRDDKPKYERDEKTGKYIIVNHYKEALPGPNEKHIGPLPRMWSSQHAENYMKYFGPLDFSLKKNNEELRRATSQLRAALANGEIDEGQYITFLRRFGEELEVQPPSVWDNIRFMFQFQFGYMYWRYFMWNFVGKQDDKQGRYNGQGEWLSGIKFIDAIRLGSQDNLPQDKLDNKGRNTYFFLPLLLGIIGIIFQISRNPKQFWVLFVFFMFTGIAIQFYTNPYVFQPRERDYSLVGSFYIFSIWIGMGVLGLYEEFKKWISPKIWAPVISLVCLLAVPTLMAYQNWDDHDRSGRYTARSSAKAYLDSCVEDAGAMLFTIGDNDTFPLWYAQEIEKYRTDVRVICTSLFATDWYVDQMKRKAYESEPIPSQLTHNLYRYGNRDVIYYQQITENRWNIKDFMNWIGSDRPETKLRYYLEKNGGDINEYPESTLDLVYYPTNKIRVPVNKENVLKYGIVKPRDSALIVDYIDIDLPNAMAKNRIMMLDILANNDWKRPIYFSGGSFDDAEYLWMKDYLQLEGLAYKLVPIKTQNRSAFELGRIDTDRMYEVVMNWEWGNSGSSEIYHDTQTRSQGLSFRSNLARLMEALIAENKIEKAKNVIELAMTHLPVKYFEFYTFVEPFVDGYYQVGETEKARELFNQLKDIYLDRLDYYAGIPLDEQYDNIEEILGDMEAYRRIIDILIENDLRELAEKETLIFNEQLDRFQFTENPLEESLPEIPEVTAPDPDLPDSTIVPDSSSLRDTVIEN